MTTRQGEKPLQINVSAAALKKAEQLNKAATTGALNRANARTLLQFVEDNSDAIVAHQSRARRPSLHTYLDGLMADLKIAEKKTSAVKRLRQDALFFANKSGLRSTDIETGMLRLKRISEHDIQAEMDRRTLLRGESVRDFFSAGLSPLKALGLAGRFVSNLPYYLAALVFYSTIKPIAKLYTAITNRLGWSVLQRQVVLGSIVGASALPLVLPVNAMPYAEEFTRGKLAQHAFHKACQNDPRILRSGRLTAAFAVSLHTEQPVARMHYLSAMESIGYGMSPIPAYLVTVKETGNFLDTVAKNSSASGAYQSIRKTKILWLAQYGQKTPYYLAAKERLASSKNYSNRASDETFVMSLDTLVQDYKSNPQSVIKALEGGRTNLAYLNAFQNADNAIISGQLFAAEVQARAPYLSIANLENKSLAEIVALNARYYQTHLLGPGGSKFFSYILRNAPELRMNNDAELKRLYASFDPKAGAGEIAAYAAYYKNAIAKNRGVFKNGEHTTATQFNADIEKFVQGWASNVTKKIQIGLTRGETALEICLNDPAVLKALVPQTTTHLELFGMLMARKYQERVPGTVRDVISTSSDTAIGLIQEWTSKASKMLAPLQSPRSEPAQSLKRTPRPA